MSGRWRPWAWLLAVLLAPPGAAGGPDAAGVQRTPCPRPLATATAREGSYAIVDAGEFDNRVFLYVPAITAAGRNAFRPFEAWLVEGIYGRPFVQRSGALDAAGFDRLKNSRNVRATPVGVSRDGDTGRVTIGRQAYLVAFDVQVGSSGSVRLTICRPGV